APWCGGPDGCRTADRSRACRSSCGCAEASAPVVAPEAVGPVVPHLAVPAAVDLPERRLDVARVAHGLEQVVDATLAPLRHQELHEGQGPEVEAHHPADAAVGEGVELLPVEQGGQALAFHELGHPLVDVAGSDAARTARDERV